MTPCLRFKPGFTWARPSAGGARLLGLLDVAATVLEHDLTLTAGTNDHTTGRHATGEAFDVSVQGLTAAQILQAKRELDRLLRPTFTVQFECPAPPEDPILRTIAVINPAATAPHLHTQVAINTVYPPADAGEGVRA